MGFISQLTSHKEIRRSPTDSGTGRALWREVFGGVSKEDGHRSSNVVPGGAWGRSLVGADPAQIRLLQAMRSMAPGGWPDDRWEQSRHEEGISYVAIHRKCEQLSQAEFAVFRRDDNHPDGKRPVKKGEPGYEVNGLLEHPNKQDSFGDLCFAPGTRVRMADGTEKKIEDVCLLDNVVSAEGNIRKVHQCHVRPYNGDLVHLKLWGHSHLRMTPNHPVLTERGYVPAEDLTKDDWVVMPRYTPEPCSVLQTKAHAQVGTQRVVNATHKAEPGPWANYRRIPDFIRLTPAAGRIFGLYLAEGHTEPGRVVWSFATKETDTLVADLRSLLRSEWGIDSSLRIVNERGTVTQVVICGKLWCQLFRSLCGVGAGGKRMHADLLAGPNDFLDAMFHGWIDGDGNEKRGGLCGNSVSHDLALGMFDIANHLGWRPAIRKEFPSQTAINGYVPRNRRPVWKVLLNSTSDSYRVRLENGRMWRRVRAVERSAYSGNVFNIGVEGDNSYVAEGVGTHNCYRWGQQIDLTGETLTWMIPNKLADRILELYVMPTAICVPQPAINPDYPDGYYRIQPLYPYGPFSTYPTPTTSVGAPIPAQWMMRFVYPHPLLRYAGLSPQTALRLWIDELTQIDRSRWYKNKRAINPSAVLNFKDMEEAQPLGEAEINRVRAEFENDHQGSENAGRLFVAPPGGALEEWGSPIKDMDYPNGWSQMADAILNGFGMTKAGVGMSDATSYSAYFAALKQIHLMTLQPMCNRFAAGVTRTVAPFFGDDLIVEIRCPKIDDHEVVFQKVDKLISAKAGTKNEVRKLLDLEVTQEPWGEEIAGFEEPAEQPGMPGAAPGQPANGAPPSADAGAPPQPPELEKSRPNPGKLASGSKGPTKSIGDYHQFRDLLTNGYHAKSQYHRVRELVSNGK